MVLPASRRIPRVLRYSGAGYPSDLFAYGAVTRSGLAFQPCSAKVSRECCRSTTPGSKPPGLASFPFARRYLGNRFYFLFLRVLRCFSSPRALRMTMNSSYGDGTLLPPGSPIRSSTDQSLLAAPRSFSQLATTFFGVWCLGIHPVLLLA